MSGGYPDQGLPWVDQPGIDNQRFPAGPCSRPDRQLVAQAAASECFSACRLSCVHPIVPVPPDSSVAPLTHNLAAGLSTTRSRGRRHVRTTPSQASQPGVDNRRCQDHSQGYPDNTLPAFPGRPQCSRPPPAIVAGQRRREAPVHDAAHDRPSIRSLARRSGCWFTFSNYVLSYIVGRPIALTVDNALPGPQVLNTNAIAE